MAESRIKEGAYIIGGPLGLAPEVLQRAGCVLSLSRMTFTNRMMRMILLEQMYRWMRIMRKELYHR
ncbi:MAG: 23S rRNA (pseudouridine(1915)-N(3))-methyltransferase RlmH [Methanothrix sp.]